MLIENAKINYNGLKAPLIEWPELEHFSPPRTMLCAVDHLDYAQVLHVYAYDPDRDYPVITEKGAFKYCADVPEWTYETVKAYLAHALPGVLVEKGGVLHYDGNGAAELGAATNRIIATGVCVYYSFGNDDPTAYVDVTVAGLDRMVRDMKAYHEKMAGRATNIELAQWCSAGHGMWKLDGADQCYTHFDPVLGTMNKAISSDIRIWPWDKAEWLEPTRKNMGISREKEKD